MEDSLGGTLVVEVGDGIVWLSRVSWYEVGVETGSRKFWFGQVLKEHRMSRHIFSWESRFWDVCVYYPYFDYDDGKEGSFNLRT